MLVALDTGVGEFQLMEFMLEAGAATGEAKLSRYGLTKTGAVPDSPSNAADACANPEVN